MSDTAEFFHCREVAQDIRSRLSELPEIAEIIQRERADVARVEKCRYESGQEIVEIIKRERAAGALEEKRRYESRQATFGTVAVNQLLVHLDGKKQDAQTQELIAALRASYRVR